MTEKPLVSIITVVRNGEKVIERTIKSVVNQTFSNFEYIVIDGASNDKTLEIINKYKSKISRIISEPDKSHFDAMNKALRMAKGTYVWFVHAGDEIYSKNTLEKVFAKEKDGDAYYGDTILVNADGEEQDFFRGKKVPVNLTWKDMSKGPAVNHQAFILRKSLASKYDFEQYPICADTDWIINGLKRSQKIVNTHQIMIRFMTGGISAKHESKTWIEHYGIYNKHFGILANFINHFFMVPNYLSYRLFGKRL